MRDMFNAGGDGDDDDDDDDHQFLHSEKTLTPNLPIKL